MKPEAIAIHFADQLCRTRALTPAETDMLVQVVEKQRRRVLWTARDDRELQRLSRLMPAHVVADRMGRTADSVRSRLRQLKRMKVVRTTSARIPSPGGLFHGVSRGV